MFYWKYVYLMFPNNSWVLSALAGTWWLTQYQSWKFGPWLFSFRGLAVWQGSRGSEGCRHALIFPALSRGEEYAVPTPSHLSEPLILCIQAPDCCLPKNIHGEVTKVVTSINAFGSFPPSPKFPQRLCNSSRVGNAVLTTGNQNRSLLDPCSRGFP